MQKFDVTVIIPAYNSEKTIEKCVDSVLTQTLKNVEIIVINDGSVDSTSKKLSKYSEYSQLSVINQENHGVSYSRNIGIKNSNGKYIFFLDSDDYIEKDLLKQLFDYAVENDLDLVSGDHLECNSTLYGGNESKKDTFFVRGNEIGNRFLDVFPKCVWAKLFRTEVIRRNGIVFPEKMSLGEDLYFSYLFFLKAESIGKCSGAKYIVQNVNPNSLSKKYVPGLENDLEEQLRLWKKLVKKYPAIESNYYLNEYDIELYFIAAYINNLYKWDCPLSKKEKRELLNQYLISKKEIIISAGKGIKCPKNRYQKILSMVLKTRNAFLIGLFFKTKEKIKVYKFNRSKE